MLNQTDLSNLQQRFSDQWNATQFNNLVAFIQEEFNSNKLNYPTMFEAIHHTNIASLKYLKRSTSFKFAHSFAKFISQAIISASGVNVLQAYQDARNHKADKIVRELKKSYQWQIIDGVATYTESGKTFQLTWDETKSNLQLMLDEKSVFKMAVAGYGFKWVATLIDSAVFDEL